MVLSTAAFSYTDEDAWYIKQTFGVDITTEPPPMTKEGLENANRGLQGDFNDPSKIAKHLDDAVAAWVNISAFMLERKGYQWDADNLRYEYSKYYSSNYQDQYLGIYSDLYDHDPLSQWLARAYDLIEGVLGIKTCQLLHLDDIREVDYGLYVVLKPRGDANFTPPKPWGIDNYRENFVPSAEGITYWVTYGICTGISFGMGVVIMCSPIGELAEEAMDLVSPKISDKVYTHYNPW